MQILNSKKFRSLISSGKQFEIAEKGEWKGADYNSAFERIVSLESGRRGRIDILLDEANRAKTIIEVKGTNWDSMADYRVRPNVLRHARQVISYVTTFWEKGIDVCPALVYPRKPASAERKRLIELLLEQRCVQVVWAEERSLGPGMKVSTLMDG